MERGASLSAAGRRSVALIALFTLANGCTAPESSAAPPPPATVAAISSASPPAADGPPALSATVAMPPVSGTLAVSAPQPERGGDAGAPVTATSCDEEHPCARPPAASLPGDAGAGDAGAAEAGRLSKTNLSVLRRDFGGVPLYLTGSFDGSQRFSMWLDTMAFARKLKRLYGQPTRFTYFINTAYYDVGVRGSWIGRAHSQGEVLVRRALTQIAINEGHEVANHGVRHEDGGAWDAARWRREMVEFHAVTDKALFRPLRGADGHPAFPRFEPLAGAAAGATGAACETDADCHAGTCLVVTARERFCTQPCNRHRACPAQMACGAPSYNRDTDACVPLPRYPLEHEGAVLFDEHGAPNLEHPALRPYRIVGFRAPFLSYADGLFEALLERKYIYDASWVSPPSPPVVLQHQSSAKGMLGFALMPQPGSRTIPMDYNYFRAGIGGEAMAEDYRRSILAAYRAPQRVPWGVGHHFALWNDGAYWRAFQEAFTFAARGCPEPEAPAQKRCPDVRLVSYRQLSSILKHLPRPGSGMAAAAPAGSP